MALKVAVFKDDENYYIEDSIYEIFMYKVRSYIELDDFNLTSIDGFKIRLLSSVYKAGNHKSCVKVMLDYAGAKTKSQKIIELYGFTDTDKKIKNPIKSMSEEVQKTDNGSNAQTDNSNGNLWNNQIDEAIEERKNDIQELEEQKLSDEEIEERKQKALHESQFEKERKAALKQKEIDYQKSNKPLVADDVHNWVMVRFGDTITFQATYEQVLAWLKIAKQLDEYPKSLECSHLKKRFRIKSTDDVLIEESF